MVGVFCLWVVSIGGSGCPWLLLLLVVFAIGARFVFVPYSCSAGVATSSKGECRFVGSALIVCVETSIASSSMILSSFVSVVIGGSRCLWSIGFWCRGGVRLWAWCVAWLSRLGCG